MKYSEIAPLPKPQAPAPQQLAATQSQAMAVQSDAQRRGHLQRDLSVEIAKDADTMPVTDFDRAMAFRANAASMTDKRQRRE
jgi:hypothetical protein